MPGKFKARKVRVVKGVTYWEVQLPAEDLAEFFGLYGGRDTVKSADLSETAAKNLAKRMNGKLDAYRKAKKAMGKK